MKIIIETIPHKDHPYSTCGDWQRDKDGNLRIDVSEEIGDKFALLVALHELVEVALCEDRGITQQAVDEFDRQFESNRKEGDLSEPGDSVFAPYRKEHFFATNLERLMAAELNVDWDNYEDAVNSLP